MKFGYYVIYGKTKKGFETFEEYEKAWATVGEVIKKVDLELLFWGTPFGIVEDGMCVLKGDVTNFEKLWNNPELHMKYKFPITDRRTTLILIP